MRTHASIIAVTGMLLVITLLFGIGLSRNLRRNDPRLSGKPIAGAMSTVHKLMALATAITLAVAIRRLHRGIEFSGIELTLVIIAGLLFLLMIVSGSLLSLGQARNDAIFAIHKVLSALTVIPTFGAIYLLTRGRW
jgi:hypothetical protein